VSEAEGKPIWWLYIVRCGDGTLYTGVSTDVARRLEEHRAGEGARYTRGRGPLALVYRERCAGHGDALRRELAVKRLSRAAKERLIQPPRRPGRSGRGPRRPLR
jgi:predicted GIY-YIG superfamily endonuclease